LPPTISLINDLSLENIQNYVNQGLPIIFHLGFCNLSNRVERAKFWKSFWSMATNGDENNHITDINELEKRFVKEHNLPLWKIKI